MSNDLVRTAYMTARTSEISDAERDAARQTLNSFSGFLNALWSAQQKMERLINVLGKIPNIQPEQLFEVRQHLRVYQREVREMYAALIPRFSAALQIMRPLSKDTETSKLKETLLNAMQELAEVVESFLETLEDFNSPDQVERLKSYFVKSRQLAQSIEGVVEGRLKDHFERDIIRKKSISDISFRIRRRARMVKMMEA